MPIYRVSTKDFPPHCFGRFEAHDAVTAAFVAGCHMGSPYPFEDEREVVVTLDSAGDDRSSEPATSTDEVDNPKVYAVVPNHLNLYGKVALFRTMEDAIVWQRRLIRHTGEGYYVAPVSVIELSS